MGLKEYKAKRDFKRTPEPAGQTESSSGASFVIHKHDASHLHYDLRLELDGVLKSWAVPKGPSVDPANKRLAVQVEDHPLDYGGFEGTIPKGEYGGGTVMLWDRGQWKPIGDPHKGLAKGHIEFELLGEKLHGRWTLIRTGGPRRDEETGKANWLLMKAKDDYAHKGAGETFLEDNNLSVLTGRNLNEIAEDLPPSPPPKAGEINPSNLAKARAADQPNIMNVELATLVERPPDSDNWLHEVKLDGYRILCILKNGAARLYTRNQNDWTGAFAHIARAAQRLPVEQAVIDGEVVILNAKGISDFQALQNLMKMGRHGDILYYAFDIVHCNGYDLTATPLIERKELLRQLLQNEPDPLRYSDHIQGHGKTTHEQACQFGLEGIVSKKIDSPYRQTRSKDWLKTKCRARQEFVIGGYIDPGGSRKHFGALLLGYYDGPDLIYCGRAGTGFTEQSLKRIHGELTARKRDTRPFKNPPDVRKAHWVEPELVAEVEFAQWTDDNILRQASFQGLRLDKNPTDVIREQPQPPTDKAPARKGKRTVAGIHLSHPDRVLYPAPAITKETLAQFYESIADRMLPHIAGRPLMLLRCPNGVGSECFHQKHFRDYMPKGMHTVDIPEKSTVRKYAVIENVTGLVGLVQLGVLEFHIWGCREDEIEKPDRMIFDLDPGPNVPWAAVIECALTLRARLEALSLKTFVKTSGGKGLHVVVPIRRTVSWEQFGAFARNVAESLVHEYPKLYTATMRKDRRTGKVFVDHFRNGRGATCVAAYSTRARTDAPVSTPITWEELPNIPGPDTFTVANLYERLDSLPKDPWEDSETTRQTLKREHIS